MAKGSFGEVATIPLLDVFGNGKVYRVPRFQRDYSWEEDNWEDLWEDIVFINEHRGETHYMGSIVLLREPNSTREYKVIDGQQRMASICLLALACIEFVDRLDNTHDDGVNKIIADELKRIYIGFKQLPALSDTPKLFLNKNNSDVFNNYLLQMRDIPKGYKLPDSSERIKRCLEFFRGKTKNLFIERNYNAQAVADFVKNFGESLLFIQIVSDEDVNAYTIFETLNARGVKLTATDLLKNHLFLLASQGGEMDLAIAEAQWENVIKRVEYDSFGKFLRYYWISEFSFERESTIYKAVKSNISTSEKARDLLEKLIEGADIYEKLSDYNSSYWAPHKLLRKSLRGLNVFGVTQQLPLLMHLMYRINHYGFDYFYKIVRLCEILMFRSVIIGNKNPNVFEKFYTELLGRIRAGERESSKFPFKSILDISDEVNMADEEFKVVFSRNSVSARKRSKRLCRYILYEIENYLSEGKEADFETDVGSIEHILPEKGDHGNYPDFPGDALDSYTSRLGNYVILEEKINNELGSERFSLKTIEYGKSRYKTARYVSEKFGEWNRAALNQWQEYMADVATKVWSLDSWT